MKQLILAAILLVGPTSDGAAATQEQTTAPPVKPQGETGVKQESVFPKGIKLIWDGYYNKSYYSKNKFIETGTPPPAETRREFAWGATKADIQGALNHGKFAISIHSADPQTPGLELVFTGLGSYDGWYADFGRAPRAFTTALYLYNGQFFRYSLTFPTADLFSFVRDALASRLGTPTTAKQETVENRMGATFPNETVLWESSEVIVKLEERSSNVTEGELTVTFLPIAATIPAPTPGNVPF